VLQEENKLQDAEAATSAACAILDRKLAPDDPDNVFSHYELASLMQRRAPLTRRKSPSAERRRRRHRVGLQEGSRHEWMRHAVNSLLGSLQLDGALDPSLAPAPRTALFKDAESLLIPAGDRLLKVAPKWPQDARLRHPAALGRSIRLYQEWEKSEPGQGYAAKAETLKAALDAFEHPPAKDPK